MNTPDKAISEHARKALAEQRQHTEHRQELMNQRIAEELDQLSEPWIEEQARELATRQRHHDEQENQSVLSRATAEVNLPMPAPAESGTPPE